MELYYDLHMHSCLSPCADDDMTPNNIVNMAKLAGLEIIAVTDHNSCLNLPAVQEAADSAGLLLVPGMELTTAEEVHVLCLLPSLCAAMSFSEHVRARLAPIDNVADIFGRQTVMDALDRPTGEESIMLAGATDIGVFEAAALLKSYGGVALPAHIDRPSFSLLENLGFVTSDMGFTAAELSRRADSAALLRAHPLLGSLHLLRSSDAHALSSIPDAQYRIEVAARTAKAVVEALGRQPQC